MNAPSAQRIAIARRVADAHRGIGDASLLSFVSGSTVEELADDRSDVDMSVVFATLPSQERMQQACREAAAGAGGDWFWTSAPFDATEGVVVAFHVDGIEVQIAYTTEAALNANIDQLLVAHDPDTPNHKLAEGLLKALPLAGDDRVRALQQRLARFPDGLRAAMIAHGLATPTPWKAATQLVHRDAGLWCREIQVEACYRLLLVLSGLNRRYFTRFQVKRMRLLASRLLLAPPRLAERIEALLALPAPKAFDALHALEGQVLDLVAQEMPEIDLTAAHRRRSAWVEKT
jgi:hypothetical protein